MATTHTVKQGECLSSIAKHYGFANWRTIYDHPQNADFKEKRPNPNVICPGDRIVIPDKEEKRERAQTGKLHRYVAIVPQTRLRIVLQDEDGEPLAGKRYKLEVAGTTYEGTTDADGLLDKAIPADAEGGELTSWLNEQDPERQYTWLLRIGHLDPVEELSGVQARLNNLGFDCGPVDGINGPMTKAAVRAFQEQYGLKVDGIAGSRTQAKLKEVYRC